MSERERVIDLSDPLSPEEAAARAAAADAAAESAEETRHQLAVLVRWIYMSLARAYKGDMEYGTKAIPQWDGGVDQWGRNCTRPVWPRLARFLLERNVDPVTYMRAQFTYMDRGRIPAPTAFFSDNAVSKYHCYCTEWPQSLRAEYDAAILATQATLAPCVQLSGWDYQRALRYALGNKLAVQASAMFRYCVAENNGLPDLAAVFHDEALGDYVFQKNAYDTAWGNIVPAKLREEADQIRATMLSY